MSDEPQATPESQTPDEAIEDLAPSEDGDGVVGGHAGPQLTEPDDGLLPAV